MIALDFRDLVKSFCEHAQLTPWEEVLAEREVEIDGLTVGLGHDDLHAPDCLSLYVDLGDCPAGEDVKTRLLEGNLRAAPGHGCMALLAHSNLLVYRVDLPWLEPMSGSMLADRIDFHLHVARQALQNAMLH